MNKIFAPLFGLAAIVPFGFAASIENIIVAVCMSALVYLTTGILFGWIRKSANWLWGLLIATPIMTVLFVSMAFTGIFTRFWDTDVPLVIPVIIAPCLGVLIGGRLRH